MACHEKSWITMKICDTLLPNGMPCHHHMEDRIVINHKGQQYYQLTCRNPSLGLATKARVCKGVGQD